jgi:xylulokinase
MGKDLIFLEEQSKGNAFDLLFSEAKDIPLGSDGVMVLPYFLGQRMPDPNPNASGAIFGLKMHHRRGHIVHATFEGIGYNIAQLISLLGDQFRDKANIKAIGGGTKTPLWLQIVSDICGISQAVPEVKIGAAYGDALLAGLGIGLIQDKDAIKSIIKTDYIIEPDFHNFEKYQKYLEINKKLYTSTVELMSELWATISGNYV